MIGTQLSHFRILRKLGAGGMGEVYEAEDVSLGRRVALKLLPGALQQDAEALERFRREARAASALHHPNICTIFEVGEDQGRHFIAMEMLEGTPLDEMIGGRPLKITTVLDLGAQVSEALRAAHEAGVIHRDVKPANILVTRTGLAKLVDFGIAKVEPAPAAANSNDDDRTLALGSKDYSMTRPGTAVGTVAYMSPEQASGQALDARTDLFSLGAVLYEMVTGHPPFTGATSAVIFNAILSQAPAAAASLNRSCPPELEAVISKCLEKDREMRCQSAAELRADLMRIRRKLESGSAPTTGAQAVASAVTTGVAPAKPPSSSAVLIAEARRHKLAAAAVALAGMALVAGAGYGIYQTVASRPFPFEHNEMRQVQDEATVLYSAISPDGKYLADVHREARGEESIHLRLLTAASETEVMPSAPVSYAGITFSHDGTALYFRRVDDSGACSLYRVPQLGGTAMLVESNVASDPALSPDGSRIAFMRSQAAGAYSLVLADAGGGNEKTLLAGLSQARPLAWSPDGKTIATSLMPGESAGGASAVQSPSLLAVSVNGGSTREIKIRGNGTVDQLAWSPDGEGVLALYRGVDAVGRGQIAYVDYPEGTLHRVTNDTTSYSGLSLTSDGKLLAAVEVTSDDRNLFVLAAGEPRGGQQLTEHRTVRGFTWLPDGSLVAAADFSLVLIDHAGAMRATLFDPERDGQALFPSACGNGKDLVFAAIGGAGSSAMNLWRMDAAGGNLQQLTSGGGERDPVCSGDSQSVFYQSNGAVERLPLAGGAAEKATDLEDWRGWFFDVSRDGKLLAMITPGADGRPRLALVKPGAREAPRMLEVPAGIASGPRFLPDGAAVAYSVRRSGADNLWQQPLAGGMPRALTAFGGDEITDFHWSARGELGVVRGHTDSVVVLIREAGKAQ